MRADFFTQLKKFMASAKGARRKFVSFLLEENTGAAFMTIEDLAKAAGVSAGMISRIVREIGFEGFSQFQKNLREEIRKDITPAARLAKTSGEASVFKASLDKDLENLGNIAVLNSEEAFLQAACLTAAAPAVHVLALRSSYPLAFFTANILEQLRDNVTLMDFSTGRLVEHIMHFKPGDTVIVISYPRYLRSCILVAQEAKRAGCSLVAITDSHSSPLSLYADVSLVAPYESSSYFNSLVGPFGVVNSFLAQIVRTIGPSSQQRLELLVETQDRWKLLIDSKDAWQLTLPGEDNA